MSIRSVLNKKTAFAKEKTGVFEAEGFFDGSVIIHVNKKYIDEDDKSEFTLQEHSAPITDIMFIVTHYYGTKIQEDTPTSSRLFLASSSYDQTIIIWQLYDGVWSVAKRFEFEDSYCTSISAPPSNIYYDKIYFGFSDGRATYIDINDDATKMVNIKKYDNDQICLSIFANSDNNENEVIIVGNSKGEIQCTNNEETQILKNGSSSSRKEGVLYIDVDPPYIVATFKNGLVLIIDKLLSKTKDITPALKDLDKFIPVMAKFDHLTHAIKILSDKGQIVTVMKFPNGSYKLIK